MNNKTSIISKSKQFCVDKLWFVLLLTPLFIIAVVMFQHFQPNKKQQVNRGLTMVVGAVEISTAELASIVAKPLTELIAMEVYAAVNQSAATTKMIREADFRQATYSQLSEIRRTQDNPIKVISYAIEQNATKIKREAS